MNRDLFAAAGGVVDATTDPYFNSTTLLLSGDGTNGAQNNTFVDSSVNNATITRAGTPTQGSFSPFSQTGWSGYFNATSYVYFLPSNYPSGTTFAYGTGNFTLECWVYTTSIGTTQFIWTQSTAGTNYFNLDIDTTGIVQFNWGGGGGGSYINSPSAILANTWTHIAIVRLGTGTNQTVMYINGTNVVTGTVVQDFTNLTYAPTIGNYSHSPSLGFIGYISNFRIVKGTAVYTGNFTPPTAPLTATQAAGTNIAAITGTSTSLLTLQDNRFKDNALTPNTITVTGTPSIQAFSPFAPTAAYSVPAATAGSAYFNGSSYISVPDSTAFTMGSGDFTLEAWVYLTTSGVSRVIIGTCDAAGSAGSMSFVLGVNASNNATFAIGYAGALYTSTNTATVPTNQWVHIAGVRNGGGIYAYLNGIQSTSNTSMASLAITDSTQVVAIGRNGAYNGEYVTGYISNARIVKGTAVYTVAFNPPSAPLAPITNTSLLTLQDSTFKDNSTNVATITASSPAPVIQSFTPFTQVWGGYFDGSTDYLLTTNVLSNADNFTIECWVYPQAGASGRAICGAAGWELYLSGFTVNFVHHSVANFNSSLTLKQDSWNHVVVERYNFAAGTSGGYRIFVNGVMYDTGGITAGAGTALPTQTGLLVGGSYYVSTPRLWWAGYISNLRIVKGVAVYTNAFTPPTKTLSATQAAGTNISAIYPGQTSLLTLQDPTFKDNATLPNTITAAGTPKAQLVSAPFTSAATVDPVNGSAYFNGTSNLAVPAGAPFNLTTVDFCIEMWVYPIAQSQYGALLSLDLQDFPLVISWAAVLGTNISFSAGTSGAWFANTNGMSFGTTITNNWTHLLITRVGDSWRTFQDGVLRGSTTQAGSIGDSAGSVYVGSNGAAGGFSAAYISNLRIIKGTGNVPAAYQTSSTTLGTAIFTPPTAPLTAVTGTSLLTLQDTTFKDNSTNAAVITAGGSPVIRAFTPFASNWGGYFDGSSYISAPKNTALEPAISGAWTIEFLCYTTSTSSQSPWAYGNATISSGPDLGTYFNVIGNSAVQAGFYSSTQPTTISGGTLTLNQWHHLALVSNGTMMTLYLNGISVGTPVNISGTAINAPSSATGRIGQYNSGSPQYFNGYISNFRFVKGTAVYTTNFQPPSAPLTAITGTSLLTLQNNAFIDNSTNALAITVVGAPKTQLLQLPFTSSITKVAAPWNVSVTAPLATVGGSMYLNGGTDYLQTSSTAGFAMGTGDFTIESWVYAVSGANNGILQISTTAGGFQTATNTSGFALSISTSNSILLSINAQNLATSTNKLPFSTWTHLALVRNSGVVKLYINGVLETSIGSSGAIADTTNYTTTYMVIGGYYNTSYLFNGYISNFRIVKGTAVYTSNFTPPTAPPQPTQTPGLLGTNVNAVNGTNTSLLLLGTNAGIYDATAKNDIVTVGDTKVSSTQIKYGTGAMYFDGTGDYLTMPASINWMFGTGDFTVEFWINTAGANSQILSLVGGTAAGNWQVSLYGGSIYWQSARNTTDTYVVSSSAISNSAWHHVAYCRTSNALKVYFDGVAQGAGINDTTNYNISSVLNVGYSSSYFTGYLDDLRITKYARYPGSAFPTKAMLGQ